MYSDRLAQTALVRSHQPGPPRCLPCLRPHASAVRFRPVPHQHHTLEPLVFLVGTNACLPARLPALSVVPMELLPEARRRGRRTEHRDLVPERSVRRARVTEQCHCDGKDGHGDCAGAADEVVDNLAGHLAGGFLRDIPERPERPGRVSQVRGPGVLHRVCISVVTPPTNAN